MFNFPTAFLVLLLAPQILCMGDVPKSSLSNFLWTWSEIERYQALFSNFIQEISKVKLDPDQYGVYNVQDAVYFYYVKESLDIAAQKTTDPALKAFLQARSESYQGYYTDAIKTWHIEDHRGIKLGNACQNYVDHLMDVAENMDSNYLVVALTPCVKLWPWLGKQISANIGEFGIYTKWIQYNLDPEYTGFEKYESVIDEAYTNEKITLEDALSVYRKSMASEAAFFNSTLMSVLQDQHDEF